VQTCALPICARRTERGRRCPLELPGAWVILVLSVPMAHLRNRGLGATLGAAPILRRVAIVQGMRFAPLVEPAPALSPAERRRYARHTRLVELGEVGQRRLAAARVLVVGAGGLGSPSLTYLAAAGVGTIGIVDDDVVEVSNLHRQPLHGESDLDR